MPSNTDCWLRAFLPRSVHQAFGGYKHSGMGREGTSTTLREVTQEKNIALKNILK